MTVSVWFQLLKRSQQRFSTSSCTSVSIYIAESTTSISSQQGFRIRINGCMQDAIQVQVRDYSYLWTASWGNSSLESWSKQWQNIAFTYRYSGSVTLYFNGEEVSKQTVRELEILSNCLKSFIPDRYPLRPRTYAGPVLRYF